MNTFPFVYHTVRDEFPKNSVVTQFGNGYSFASAPIGLPQLTFHLSFKMMCWFTTGSPEGAFNRTYSPSSLSRGSVNLAALIDFYAANQLYQPFIYNHQVRGAVTVRFAKPFATPEGLPGVLYTTPDGLWAHPVEPFQLDLIMNPT